MATDYANSQVIGPTRYIRWLKMQRAAEISRTTYMSYADALREVGLHGEARLHEAKVKYVAARIRRPFAPPVEQ